MELNEFTKIWESAKKHIPFGRQQAMKPIVYNFFNERMVKRNADSWQIRGGKLWPITYPR